MPAPAPAPAPAISIVSPVYGCRSCLEELADRVERALHGRAGGFELILVDDASPDEAWSRIAELAVSRPWLVGLRLARNFGQHYAIAAGIEHARGERVVVMDCDLQDLPEEIPRLIDAMAPGVEAVFARRADRRDGAIKRFGSWAFFRVLSWMTGVRQDHTTANFGIYSRRVIDVINAMPERERCFPLMVKWTGLRAGTLDVEHAARTAGRSGYSFKRLLRLASGIVLSYSDKPLQIVVRLGLAFAAIGLAFALLSTVRFFYGDVQVAGYTSIIASIWLVGSVVISSLGIVGLYVGRLFVDTKARPYYIVAERTSDASCP